MYKRNTYLIAGSPTTRYFNTQVRDTALPSVNAPAIGQEGGTVASTPRPGTFSFRG